MGTSQTTFFREILAFASAGHMASVIRSVQQHARALSLQAPVAREHEPYGRSLLHRDARGEIMLAGWQTGTRCAPHDHGDARGIVVVVSGTFVETRFRHTGGHLRAVGHSTGKAGAAVPVTHGLIHDMECIAAGATLHVYLPPITTMRVYDRTTRSTLLVGDDTGAWVPRDKRHILSTEPWPTTHDPRQRDPLSSAAEHDPHRP